MNITALWACIGRQSDYALQQKAAGRYLRQFRPLTASVLGQHLAGILTLGTYVLLETGECSFAVFDADTDDGLQILQALQGELAGQGYPAYLEKSRRGGHLWLFFTEPVSAERVRGWLWPLALARNLELFPKQAGGQGIGSLIRVPLGIHQRDGNRYPFVDTQLHPVAENVPAMLEWLTQVERVVPPASSLILHPSISIQNPLPAGDSGPFLRSIREWNAAQDPFTLIGRYVVLDHRGSGLCPFGDHHQHGRDAHASFRVYPPARPGGSCWYCYTWQRGGSAFDFLRFYLRLDARTLWLRILAGEM